MEPEWLGGTAGHFGTVRAFIPGQNKQPAVVVELDAPVSAKGVSGSVLVLELRYDESEWLGSGTVHVELCDFEPEARPWKSRRQGKWVESHASYVRVPSGQAA